MPSNKDKLIEKINALIPSIPHTIENLYEIKVNDKKFARIKEKQNFKLHTVSQKSGVFYKKISKLL